MTVDLSAEEIGIITDWYEAASGESVSGQSSQMFQLLEKLGIEATSGDLYYPDPMQTIESHRHETQAKVDAITEYRRRHPDMESVKDAGRDQPTPPREG